MDGSADGQAGNGAPGHGKVGVAGKFTITINKEEFTLETDCVTVLELVKMAGFAEEEIREYDLFCITDGSDGPVDDGKPVQLEPGAHFRTIRKSHPYGS